ncbi:hypothetical protein CHUAL_003166 [Chamberlinius hualienensis]
MNNILAKLLLPELYPFVDEVIKYGKLGIFGGNVKALDVQTGAYTLHDGPCADRMKLVIPYAGQTVSWEIMFFGNSGMYPPEFRFDDKSFIPDIESMQALQEWRSDDKFSLLRLVQEMLDAYREYQLSLIEDYSRLQFEYSSLIQQKGFSKSGIEVLVDRKVKNGPVKFFIKLPCEFSQIPGVDKNNGNTAVLLINFQSPNGSKVQPQLFLSAKIEESLKGMSLRLPPFPNGGYLIDYLPTVCKLLQEKIDILVNGLQKRKDYFAAFLRRFGKFVLEYDKTNFEKMSFLFEWKNFYFVFNIEIPRFFPEDKPRLTFQSIYHLTNEQPFTTLTVDYPYSPRWSAVEMADRTKKFLLEYIPEFQKTSIRNLK